ncbi:MAG TPA: lamin tail domain-containing protein [Bacilli bacterium]|mgnify:CR=1 FL=1|nr:lamin tail domain-containing protein [Bacilli bacterium]
MFNKKITFGSALLLTLFLSGCQSSSLVPSSSTPTSEAPSSAIPSSEVTSSLTPTSTTPSSSELPSSEPIPVGEPDLFFSEYIEGPGTNKVLELYNPTSTTIDLTKYTVKLFSNGRDLASSNIMKTMEGTLEPGETFVFYNVASDTFDTGLLAAVNAVPVARKWVGSYDQGTSTGTNVANHNGDDAFGLFKNDGSGDVLIDAFGTIGFDPGTAWNATFANGSGNTMDAVLTRIPSIHSPSVNTFNIGGTDYLYSFNPLEWSYASYTTGNPAVHTVGTHTIS